MKIATWNCNGALRKKFEYLLPLQADIYIVQECENPAETKHDAYRHWAANHVWIGDAKNKGLGIFAAPTIRIQQLNWTAMHNDQSVKYFLPCRIHGTITLIAVWAHKNNSQTFAYIGQFWKYLQLHKEKLTNAIIAGDFNSNVRWDTKKRWWNHSDVVRELRELGIESLYHLQTGEQQGKESVPTFYLYKNLEKSYHIDYIFASQLFSSTLKSLEIGQTDKWLGISDHMPVVCELEYTLPL